MMQYGFYDRLTKDFPSQINVDLIALCNYACIHCPCSMMEQEHKLSHALLSEELNRKLVDEVRSYGVNLTQQIRYAAAGEPFLHPHVMEILDYAVKNSGVLVSVTTNGSLVTNERADQLLKMGLGLIDFSLDAYSEETYREIRLHGNLERVREHILYMLKRKKEENYKTRIVVSFVVQEKNEAEKKDFERYWKEQGVDYVIFRKLHSVAGRMFQKEKEGHVQPCVYPWERICISEEGKMLYCPALWEGDPNFEFNLAEHSIHEVWNGEVYETLRREHIADTFERFKRCETCPDRGQMIWPFQRTETWKGYGDMIGELTK